MLRKWTSVEDRKFLFPSEPLIGRLLTAHPLFVFLALSTGCSVIVLLPAAALHLLSIPINFQSAACTGWDSAAPPYTRDVGILHKWNWSIGYSVAIPLIFALASAASRRVKRSLIQLVSDGTVQPDVGNQNRAPFDFVEKIARDMLRWDKVIFRGSVVLALMATLTATNLFCPTSNLRVYARVLVSRHIELKEWHNPCTWDDIDWMHGWTISTISQHHSSCLYVIGNFLFYLLAEALQGFVIFLACYFVLKFLALTHSFATVIINDGSGFHFEPFISDPERCLGLRPIGRLFSMFLLLSIFFQIFAFGLRLQSILVNQHIPLLKYFYEVAGATKDLTNPKETVATSAMSNLFQWAGFTFKDLNAGLFVTIILMVVPMGVIAWWPIVRMRNYVSAVRRNKLQEFRIEEQKARQTKRYDAAQHTADDMEKLAKSSIWPNGFKIGWGSFFFLFALLMSTIAPPLIVPLIGGGLGLKILKKITSD